MTKKLIGLPFRLGLRSAGVVVRGLGDLAEWSLDLVGTATGLVKSPARDTPQPPTDPAPEPRATPGASPAPASPPAPVREPPPPTPPAPVSATPIPEPDTIVYESAEPGAEDGAGAEVSIAEPWPGYGQLAARDLIERLSVASAAELAAVELYESGHRRRKTVLAAAEQQLKDKSTNNSDREG